MEHSTLERADRRKQYLATFCVSLSGLCVGASLGWTSPAIPQMIAMNVTTTSQEGIIGSMLPLGALISAVPIGYLADLIGRRNVLLLSGLPLIASFGLLYMWFWQPIILYTGRFLGGLGCGAMFVCIPMYVGEIAESSIRGSLVSFFELLDTSGILLSAVLGTMMDFRSLTLILFFVSIIFTGLLFFIPETPAYLLKIGNTPKAVKGLKYFRGSGYLNIEDELREMENLSKEANSKETTTMDLFTSTSNRRAIIAGLGIMSFRQLSGVQAVIFYTVSIFMLVGDQIPPYLATVIVDTVQVISAFVAVKIIDKADRTFYLKLSSIGMGISLATLGLHYHNHELIQIRVLGAEVLPVISLVVFIACFCIGYGPVPLTIASELFAPDIKAKASGMAIMMNWLFAYIVTLAFPLMNIHLGSHITFYIFAGLMALATLFVHYLVPETRGKTLERIQIELNELS